MSNLSNVFWSAQIIEMNGLADVLAPYTLNLDLVPLDPDVASMEMPSCYRDMCLYGDKVLVSATVTQSIMNLQVCGQTGTDSWAT